SIVLLSALGGGGRSTVPSPSQSIPSVSQQSASPSPSESPDTCIGSSVATSEGATSGAPRKPATTVEMERVPDATAPAFKVVISNRLVCVSPVPAPTSSTWAVVWTPGHDAVGTLGVTPTGALNRSVCWSA